MPGVHVANSFTSSKFANSWPFYQTRNKHVQDSLLHELPRQDTSNEGQYNDYTHDKHGVL